MNSPVYLDYNATAPLRPAAAEAMARAQGLTGNPSSVHSFGRQARAALETAREQVAALACAKPAQVVFTSGGTEANNLALAGSGRARILVSGIEHDFYIDRRTHGRERSRHRRRRGGPRRARRGCCRRTSDRRWSR